MEMATLWNVGLTAALGLIGWLARLVWSEQQRLQILINKTREEMAKEYVTKVEVHADINRVLDRLERYQPCTRLRLVLGPRRPDLGGHCLGCSRR